MKTNEITEGWGTAFGAAIGRAVGANDAADTLERGVEYNLPANMSVKKPDAMWQMGDPITMSDGDVIMPDDGKLYQIAAMQLQKSATAPGTDVQVPVPPQAMQQLRAKPQAKKSQRKRR